jgi:hypothetical protein
MPLLVTLLCTATDRFAGGLRSLQLFSRVLFPALEGLWRSQRGLDPAGTARARGARRSTYRTLWALLEEPYWKLRRHSTDRPDLRALLEKIDTYLGQNYLRLRPDDQRLIGQYLLSLRRLIEELYPPCMTRIDPLWQSGADVPRSSLASAGAALEETIELRDRVQRSMRRELRELRDDRRKDRL